VEAEGTFRLAHADLVQFGADMQSTHIGALRTRTKLAWYY
jgi:hypothetical protein